MASLPFSLHGKNLVERGFIAWLCVVSLLLFQRLQFFPADTAGPRQTPTRHSARGSGRPSVQLVQASFRSRPVPARDDPLDTVRCRRLVDDTVQSRSFGKAVTHSSRATMIREGLARMIVFFRTCERSEGCCPTSRYTGHKD